MLDSVRKFGVKLFCLVLTNHQILQATSQMGSQSGSALQVATQGLVQVTYRLSKVGYSFELLFNALSIGAGPL